MIRNICWLALIFSMADGFGAGDLERWDFQVAGVSRSALVHASSQSRTASAPVIFVFHGHGGSAEQAARGFALEREWPEALVVYMQGLNTPGQLTDPLGKRAGWQGAPGDQGDRDLKFFDAVLARLRLEGRVDPKRVYGTGHSNGGGFTYLLWLLRADVVAAVAPSAAAARYARQLPPKPALILGGRNDALVKFEWQQRMINVVRKTNECAAAGKPWQEVCTLYPSRNGTPLITYVFDGGHRFDPAAPALIAKFFRELSSESRVPGN